jgi:hypothetical protein
MFIWQWLLYNANTIYSDNSSRQQPMTSIGKELNMTFGLTDRRMAAANSTYPKGGVQCFYDSFVVIQNFVFHIKFCGKSPALRVAAERYEQCYKSQLNLSKQKICKAIKSFIWLQIIV